MFNLLTNDRQERFTVTSAYSRGRTNESSCWSRSCQQCKANDRLWRLCCWPISIWPIFSLADIDVVWPMSFMADIDVTRRSAYSAYILYCACIYFLNKSFTKKTVRCKVKWRTLPPRRHKNIKNMIICVLLIISRRTRVTLRTNNVADTVTISRHLVAVAARSVDCSSTARTSSTPWSSVEEALLTGRTISASNITFALTLTRYGVTALGQRFWWIAAAWIAAYWICRL